MSLREVAAEAGVSMGRVQHYFASKDDMLGFALELANERAGPGAPAGAGRSRADPARGADRNARPHRGEQAVHPARRRLPQPRPHRREDRRGHGRR
ncbi:MULTISPECIES: TetR family transcriptional regulator [Amycolatopsis]|uniref:TetR family transcriptional regulator n=1 Tax=Amycolatopsis TaxID=1813 RepID=UPI001E3208C4|nr:MULTISPECIES: TetR family transcriptional regulator [Amycolatopsis]